MLFITFLHPEVIMPERENRFKFHLNDINHVSSLDVAGVTAAKNLKSGRCSVETKLNYYIQIAIFVFCRSAGLDNSMVTLTKNSIQRSDKKIRATHFRSSSYLGMGSVGLA